MEPDQEALCRQNTGRGDSPVPSFAVIGTFSFLPVTPEPPRGWARLFQLGYPGHTESESDCFRHGPPVEKRLSGPVSSLRPDFRQVSLESSAARTRSRAHIWRSSEWEPAGIECDGKPVWLLIRVTGG